MTVGRFVKDPGAVKDYSLDWSDYLDGDVIVSSSTTRPSGIQVLTSSFTNTSTTVWVAGGSAQKAYDFKTRIRTAASVADLRTWTIQTIEQ
jgi:hypothetical protein